MRTTSATAISVLLALPFAIIFALLVLHIEPDFGPLEPLLTVEVDQPNILGSAIVFGAMLLSLVALSISLVPLVRHVRAGTGITANPMNLLVAGAIFSLITLFVGAIIVDQYPCWIGVPNCD